MTRIYTPASPVPDPIRVSDAGQILDGQMAEADAGGTPVLLARVGGRLHACAAKCPHYGAPLATGVLDGPHVVCPWHHARFDVTTGALCDPPALDALQAYAVEERDGGVFVTLAEPAHVPPRAPQADGDARLFLVLGTGAAAQAAAEALRDAGFADGETVHCDACLVATGGTPRRLDVPGADAPGVHVLRSHADARAITEAAEQATRAVIVGASFIGMELASSLTDRGVAVSVVDHLLRCGLAPTADAVRGGFDPQAAFAAAA